VETLRSRSKLIGIFAALLAILGWHRSPAAEAAKTYFEDVTSSSGIRFVLANSASPQKHQIETMPGGVAVFDFDHDGLPDIFFANGAEQPSLTKTSARYSNRLYRNKGNWKFEDVTERAGLAGTGYDTGAAAGDYDNDGNVDLFVFGVHRNTLFHNRGDGTFEDVTRKAGLESLAWSVSAAWVDFDNDGKLDLFVVYYVAWDPARERWCGTGSIRTYCHPRYYQPLRNRLYHNNGDGTFTDVSSPSGIDKSSGKGMGVAIADYDHDGWMDIFVANDSVPNLLFHNEHNGTFKEVALQAGVALGDDGIAISSMGVDFRDLDNDGNEDLFVTALANQTFQFFRNLGGGIFMDATYKSHIGRLTQQFSGWSSGIFDFDNDGWKDIFVACGDVQDNTDQFSDQKPRQPNLLLLNQRDGTFGSMTVGGAALYRGAAFADFDRDGRVDAIVTRLNEPAVLLRNVANSGNHWLTIRLKGRASNHDGIGARVVLTTAGGRQVNRSTSAVGYASASDTAVHFGLGREMVARQLEIEWPGGQRQTLRDVAADQSIEIVEPTSSGRNPIGGGRS
jgi:enediyne biosynthesis protein E4